MSYCPFSRVNQCFFTDLGSIRRGHQVSRVVESHGLCFICVAVFSTDAHNYTKTFAGGPLSARNGNKLVAAGVKLHAVYGTTEFGAPVNVLDADDSQGPDANVKTSADWAWMSFSDRIRCRWVPEGDGSYELQLLVWSCLPVSLVRKAQSSPSATDV